MHKIVRPADADKFANLTQHPISLGTAELAHGQCCHSVVTESTRLHDKKHKINKKTPDYKRKFIHSENAQKMRCNASHRHCATHCKPETKKTGDGSNACACLYRHERSFVVKCEGGNLAWNQYITKPKTKYVGEHGILYPHCLKKWGDASPVSPTWLRPCVACRSLKLVTDDQVTLQRFNSKMLYCLARFKI